MSFASYGDVKSVEPELLSSSIFRATDKTTLMFGLKFVCVVFLVTFIVILLCSVCKLVERLAEHGCCRRTSVPDRGQISVVLIEHGELPGSPGENGKVLNRKGKVFELLKAAIRLPYSFVYGKNLRNDAESLIA